MGAYENSIVEEGTRYHLAGAFLRARKNELKYEAFIRSVSKMTPELSQDKVRYQSLGIIQAARVVLKETE